MEWTNNVIMEFLNSYEKHPVIWDPKHMGHKNRNEVRDAWNRIRRDISIKFPVELLKKKKESLMATYRLLRKKVMDSARLGKEEVYKPTWFAFETMDRFLNSAVRRVNTQAGAVNDDTEEQILFDDDRDDCEVKEETDLSDKNETTEIKDYEPVVVKPIQKIFRPSKRRRLSLKSGTATEFEIAKCVKQASDVFKTITRHPPQTTEQPDECSLYGQLLATKLRSMDRRTRAIVTNQIDNLVFNAEMQSLGALPTTSYDSFSEESRQCSPLVNHYSQTSAELDVKSLTVVDSDLHSLHPTV